MISNSWGNPYPSSVITDAINEAVTKGREGKGCVVVCSAGNDGTNVIRHPASLHNVIAVGAIDPCGRRKKKAPLAELCASDTKTDWGSCYGPQLNVMAPGVNIPTTSTSSPGYTTAWGTSSACPHVSGVAALVLSANPYLTQAEVRQIIASTAQKVGGYNYQYNISKYPHGSRNDEMGYGLVDAYAAVQKALQPPTISGPTRIYFNTPQEYYEITRSAFSYQWWSNTLQIVSGGNTYRCAVRPLSRLGNASLFCTVTDSNGNKHEISRNITVVNSLGSTFSIYPNPVSSTLYLEETKTRDNNMTAMGAMEQGTSKSKRSYLVELISTLTNSIVFKQAIDNPNARFELDVSSVPNGFYVIRLSQEGNEIQTQQLVVNH